MTVVVMDQRLSKQVSQGRHKEVRMAEEGKAGSSLSLIPGELCSVNDPEAHVPPEFGLLALRLSKESATGCKLPCRLSGHHPSLLGIPIYVGPVGQEQF